MKFLILFLCISSFQSSANVYSQIAKVSLEVKNASLEQVIQLLEKESGYIFLYEDAQIEQVQDLELNFKDEDLKVVLDECLQNSGLTYKLMNFASRDCERRRWPCIARCCRGIERNDAGCRYGCRRSVYH